MYSKLSTGAPFRTSYLREMKYACCIAFLFIISVNTYAQAGKKDIAQDKAAPERLPVLNALRKALQPQLHLQPSFVVEKMLVKGGFVFFKGRARDAAGKAIDFSKTAYKEAEANGAFDGETTYALLKKTGNGWKVLTFAVGPTDVVYTCWWHDYKAPKDLFDYTEACQ